MKKFQNPELFKTTLPVVIQQPIEGHFKRALKLTVIDGRARICVSYMRRYKSKIATTPIEHIMEGLLKELRSYPTQPCSVFNSVKNWFIRDLQNIFLPDIENEEDSLRIQLWCTMNLRHVYLHDITLFDCGFEFEYDVETELAREDKGENNLVEFLQSIFGKNNSLKDLNSNLARKQTLDEVLVRLDKNLKHKVLNYANSLLQKT